MGRGCDEALLRVQESSKQILRPGPHFVRSSLAPAMASLMILVTLWLVQFRPLCWATPPVRLGLSGRNSGKIPERPRKRSQERFLEFPSRVRLGCPKPYNSRHLRPPERFQNSLPPSTAGDASFFRIGSGEGLSELVMEFPAVLRVFLICPVTQYRFSLQSDALQVLEKQLSRFTTPCPRPCRTSFVSEAGRTGQETKHVKTGHVKIDRAHFRVHFREHWKISREHWKISREHSRGSLRGDPLVRFTQTKPQPSWAFPWTSSCTLPCAFS